MFLSPCLHVLILLEPFLGDPLHGAVDLEVVDVGRALAELLHDVDQSDLVVNSISQCRI